MRAQKRKASLFIGLGELASLEITESRARRQTLRIPKSGFSVSRFQSLKASTGIWHWRNLETLKPGNIETWLCFRQPLRIEPPGPPAARRRSDPTPATESSGLH